MIILTGIFGSGKSLQSQLLAKDLGYQWISTGEIFRTQLSEERQKELSTGKLLDDTEVIALVDKTLKSLNDANKVILDGFPRTIVQAEWLLSQFQHQRIELDKVINLVAPKEVIMTRLLARGRSDDNEAVIKERFKEYDTKTLPILNFFRQNGILITDINADQTPEAVHAAIISNIRK